MARPPLTLGMSPEDFRACYWLKAELTAFLRQQKAPTSGSKADLTIRVEELLRSGVVVSTPAQRRPPKRMPRVLDRSTVIDAGFRCSQELRAFFVAEIGSHFHFDATMRAFIREGHGRTLSEAIAVWQAAREAPRRESVIGAQLEFNRHMRQFFRDHPGAKREECLRAWRLLKSTRGRT